MLDAYILKIDRTIEKDAFNELLSYVSEEKRERINRYKKFEDAQRSILGDLLARHAICKRLGVNNKDLAIGVNEHGKPILLSQCTSNHSGSSNPPCSPVKTHFNVSHSGKWVVCAVDDNPVGIDVETIRPIDFNVAKRFFSEDEYLALMSQPEKTRLKYFYMIWTLKESYIKADGKGLRMPLNSFTVRIDSDNITVTSGDQIQDLYFHQSFLNNNAVYAICAFNANINETVYSSIDIFLTEAKNTLLPFP